jgi:hypothetical protein
MLYTPLMLLSYQDSNLDKQDQNLLCYRYTIRQLILFGGAKIQKMRESKKIIEKKNRYLNN